jgi:vitamin B12 transporter
LSRQVSRLRCALALAVFIPLAGAAEDPPPVELDEIVVRFPRAEADEDPTASATVVEADRYAGEAKGVAELVATAPGVAVNDYGGLGQLATASIRGASAGGVLVFLDGLPLNTAFGGGVDLSTIPRHWVERLEVVRGAEGAHYGAGALGGVLNVVTRRPEAERWSAEATAGSFETFSAAADRSFGGPAVSVLAAASADRTSGRFGWRYDPTQSQPDNGDEEERVRTDNASLRAGGIVKVAAAVGALRIDALLLGSGGRREIPPDPDLGGRAGWQEDGRALVMMRVAGLSRVPGLALAARAHARLDRLDVRIGTLSEQRGGATGIALDATWDHRGGIATAALEAGGDLVDASGTGARTRATFTAALSEDLGFAAGRVRVAPAIRFEQVGPFRGWSGKLGGSVRLAPALSVRGSAGRTFRAPAFAELYLAQGLVRPNPALVPETGAGGDVALVLDGAAGFASAGAFATLYEDLILYDAVSFNMFQPRNIGRAVASGFELEAATAPARHLAGFALSGSYTLLRTRNLKAEPEALGKALPQRARHRFYARAAIAPGRFAAHFEAGWVGRQFEDTWNRRPIDASLVLGAGAAWTLPTRAPLAVALEVKNLLDDRDLRDAIGNPLPGRMVMFTARAGATTKGTP